MKQKSWHTKNSFVPAVPKVPEVPNGLNALAEFQPEL
jgi:hypothetical protein